MKKTTQFTVLFIGFIFITFQAKSQIKPFEDNGKWGFMDSHNEVIIQPKYDKIGRQTNHLYPVYIDKNVGFINTDGKLLVEPKHKNWLIGSSHGLSILKTGSSYGVLQKGKIILPFEFCNAEVLNKNTIIANNCNFWQLYNSKGKLITNKQFDDFLPNYQDVMVKHENKWMYLTKENKLLALPTHFDLVKPVELYDNIICKVKKDNRKGIYTKRGLVLACEYDSIIFWSNEYNIAVTIKQGRYGFQSFSSDEKGVEFNKISDCIYPISENTHLQALIEYSDGSSHLPFIKDKKVYVFHAKKNRILDKYYDSFNLQKLKEEGILEVVKNGNTIIKK